MHNYDINLETIKMLHVRILLRTSNILKIMHMNYIILCKKSIRYAVLTTVLTLRSLGFKMSAINVGRSPEWGSSI